MFAVISALVFFIAFSFAIAVIVGMFATHGYKIMAALRLEPIPQVPEPRKARATVRRNIVMHVHIDHGAHRFSGLAA